MPEDPKVPIPAAPCDDVGNWFAAPRPKTPRKG